VSRLAALLACLLLAGCAGPTGTATAPAGSDVDVDTPALRAAKAAARVRPCVATSAPAAASNPLPDVTLPCLGGGPDVRLAGLRGPLVINLFAQWCGPCRAELPFYERLAREGRGIVKVLGVDFLDTQPDGALELVRATGVSYPLLADPDGLLRIPFKARGLPALVLVDAEGRVVGNPQLRAVRSYAELRGLVEDGLGVRLRG
jgi:thiol-disulfide isomerase/thioredoxin